jgi:hypothetical protein
MYVRWIAVLGMAAAVWGPASAGGTAAPEVETPAAVSAALDYAARSRERFHADLLELASKPSISSLPSHAGDILAAAEW